MILQCVILFFRLLFLLTVLPCPIEGSPMSSLLKLHDDLLKNYKPLLRPVNDTSHPVMVGFRFSPILSILNVLDQNVFLRGMMAMTWVDYNLTWEPEAYQGITKTKVPLFKDGEPILWRPELVLNESVETGFRSFQPETLYVTLYHTGRIYWYTLANVNSFCMIKVTAYPYDRQTCHLTFTTWLYQTEEQEFYHIYDLIQNKTFKKYEIDQGLWDVDIVDVTTGVASYECATCEGEEQSFVHYVLVFSRGEKILYVFIFILPCIAMSFISLLGLWLPHNADNASFILSCNMTLFVLLTFIYTELPSTGQPVIGFYIGWLIIEALGVQVYISMDSHNNAEKTNQNEPSNIQEGSDRAVQKKTNCNDRVDDGANPQTVEPAGSDQISSAPDGLVVNAETPANEPSNIQVSGSVVHQQDTSFNKAIPQQVVTAGSGSSVVGSSEKRGVSIVTKPVLQNPKQCFVILKLFSLVVFIIVLIVCIQVQGSLA